MTEKDKFKTHILSRLSLPDKEMEALLDAFMLKKIKKKQFIIQPDFTAKYRTYVVEGSFRSYVIGEDGIDHTIQFAVEDWWISDINSYIYQKPATMFVVALEDSIVLQIEHDSEQRLKEQFHKIETFFRVAAERTAAFHQRRIIASLTRTAEDRYNDFVETYPNLTQRLPQYALASYLGMTTQFLSQIRNNKLRKRDG